MEPRRARSGAFDLIAYGGIASLALGLRVWGLAFGTGLPRARPDEELYLGPALRMFDGHLDPGLLWYGFTEGFTIVLHGVLRLQAAVLSWWHGTDVHLACLFALQPTTVLLAGRSLSALLGAATIVPCALIARRLVGPDRGHVAAKLAALLLAVNYLHGRESHFGVPDTALTFAIAAALAALVRLVDEGRMRDALAAGICTGVAVAFKWTGLFMMPVLGLGLLMMLVRFRADRLVWRAGVASAAVALAFAAFLALDPHVLHQLPETWEGLLGHSIRYGEVALSHLQDPTVDVGRGLGFHTRVTLPIACGWFGLLMAVLGLVLTIRWRPWPAVACAIFLMALFVIAVGPTRLLFVRYCMPIVPAVAALAAAGLVLTAEVLRRWWSRQIVAALFVVGVAAAVVPPAVRLIEADVRLARPDTRTLAAEWVRAHGPDATLAPYVVYSAVYAIPREGVAACSAALPPSLRIAVAPLPMIAGSGWQPWSPAVARGRQGYGEVAARALDDYWGMPEADAARATFAAYGQPLLSCGKPSTMHGLRSPDPACFEEVARFGPGRPGCDAVYDLFDQFYLPFAGFAGVERPGPEVVVYRPTCGRPR